MIISVDFIYALGAAMMVCLLSLVGFIYLFFKKPWIEQFLPYVVALATGVLLGNAFFHLVPESLEQGSPTRLIWGSIFAGAVSFWLIDRVLSHRHSLLEPNMQSIKSIGPLNLIGDGFHNFIDGLVIGGSFMVSPEVGMATTFAILIHELPQELGDTGTLIFSGLSPKRVIKLNLLVGTTVLMGVAVVFLLDRWINIQAGYLLGFTAGGFIYMAIGNLLPMLYRQAQGNLRIQVIHVVVLLIGLGFIQLIRVDHTHSHKGHQHDEAVHAIPMGLIYRE